MAYRRIGDDNIFLIVLNLGNDPQIFELDHSPCGHVTLSTFLDHEGEEVLPLLELRGEEGLINSIENTSGGGNGR